MCTKPSAYLLRASPALQWLWYHLTHKEVWLNMEHKTDFSSRNCIILTDLVLCPGGQGYFHALKKVVGMHER